MSEQEKHGRCSKMAHPLLELMAAREWRIAAFACYLPTEKQGQEDDPINNETVVEMAIVASAGEETFFINKQ